MENVIEFESIKNAENISELLEQDSRRFNRMLNEESEVQGEW